MVKTNEESLLKVALVGEITHPAVEGAYMTAWDGTSMIGLGRGGINYNVKVGDPCFGWAWGEKVQSGGRMRTYTGTARVDTRLMVW